MPITLVDPQTGEGFFPDSIGNIALHRARIVAGDEPGKEPPAIDRPGFGEVVSSVYHMGLVQSIANWIGRPGRDDENFNPFTYIKQHGLDRNPRVRYLVERGQFDDSRSIEQFEWDRITGEQFLRDADVFARSSTFAGNAALAVNMVGDPMNLVPLGFAFRGAGIARTAAVAASVGLGAKLLENELAPVANEPGLTDEMIAAGISGALGGALGAMARVPSGLKRGVSSAKIEQIRLGFDRMLKESVPSADPVAFVGTTASPFGGIPTPGSAAGAARPPTSPSTITVETLPQEYAFGTAKLRELLDSPPVDNTVVRVLRQPNDENSGLIVQLQKKYKDANLNLHVENHPSQEFYDLLVRSREFLERKDLNAEATAAELGGSWLDRAAALAGKAYANLQGAVTPGGRIVNVTLARISDAYRTLLGSAQTITRGSATDPLFFESGAAAESIRDRYRAISQMAQIALRNQWRAANRSDVTGFVYDGKPVTNEQSYLAAVDDLIRRENDAHRGFPVTVPKDVPDPVRRGVEVMRGYFGRMLQEGEVAGMFRIGPRALAGAKARLEKLKTVLAEREFAMIGKENSEWHLNRVNAARRRLEKQAAEVADLEGKVEDSRFYLSQVWDQEAVASDRNRFIDRLSLQMRIADGMKNRVPLAWQDRPIVAGIAERMDRDILRIAHDAKFPTVGDIDGAPKDVPFDDLIADLTEGDLSPSGLAAYRASAEAYYRKQAAEVARAIVDEDWTDPAASRALHINQSAMADYMVRDPYQLLDRYARVVGGRMAIRRAIQLNPVWQGATLRDGTPVENGDTLKRYLAEMKDVLIDLGKRSGDPKALRQAESVSGALARDIPAMIDMLEGRDPLGQRHRFPFAAFLGRSLLRLSGMNKLGGTVWNQLNDFGPVTLALLHSPRRIGLIRRAITGLDKATRRELELLNIGLDGTAHWRNLTDTDDSGSLGFGTDRVRRLSAGFERVTKRVEDAFYRLTLLHWVTNVNKSIAGLSVLDKIGTDSRRLLRAAELVKSGAKQDDAMRRAGLHRYDAARLNKLGLNVNRAELFNRLTYEHGQLADGTAIKEKYATYDEFIESRPEGVIRYNFEEWGDDAGTKDLLDIVLSNVSAEVNRSMVVTPGVGDRPLVNRTMMGRIFNNLQSYAFAFTNQRLRVMAQMPASYQLWYASAYLFLGAMTDAISNRLSGRRSFTETAERWRENPVGMIYASWEKSGMSGWFGRPLAIADAIGIPWTPGNLSGESPLSAANRHIGKELESFAGPVASDVGRAIRLAGRIGAGKIDRTTAYNAWKLTPFQNWFLLRLLHQAFDAPTVPESILEERR